jgi:hypothetical protein
MRAVAAVTAGAANAFMWNTVTWFLGKQYWLGGASVGPRMWLKVHNPATDTWDTVLEKISNWVVGGLIVVQTSSGPALVIVAGDSATMGFVRTFDGVTFTATVYGGNKTSSTSRPGNIIAHGGLVFVHNPGSPTTAGNRQTFDPVSLSIGQFAVSGTAGGFVNMTGSFFKFDGRFWHICGSGSSPGSAASPAVLTEFAFGSWSYRGFGSGYGGVQMYLGDDTSGALANMKCAAVVVDDDTVLVFGTGHAGGGGLPVFYAYELTLSAGSGSQLVAADVTSTYDPGGLGGDTTNYLINNIGRGPDGYWYLAFANDDTLTGLGLVRVVKGSAWQDAGSMGASTAYAISLATLDGGERRDSRGTLPLVKPAPAGSPSSSAGPTGLLQNFRMDGDPLIALIGATAAGPFVDGEAISWTGGSGIILAFSATEVQIHTVVGVVPDGLLVTGAGGANATCSTSSGNGQAHTARLIYFRDAANTGLGAPSLIGTLVAGSGVNCVVSKGTGPGGSDEVITDADGSGTIKTFEWDFLADSIFAFVAENVKLQASRV